MLSFPDGKPLPLPDWVHSPTQSTTYARAFLDAALENEQTPGLSQQQLLDTAGVGEEQLNDPTGRVSLLTLWQLAGAALRLTGDDALGFAAGYRMPITAHGNLGYALMCAGTPRHALEILERFWHLRGRGALLCVSEQPGFLFMELLPEVSTQSSLQDLFFSSMLTSMYRGLGFLLPQLPAQSEIWLRAAQPTCFHRWQALLPPVRFNCHREGIALLGDLTVLDQPLPTANPEALNTALAQCAQESALTDTADHLLQRSRAALKPGVAGYPAPQDVAALLNVTPRTLRRRLQEHGYNYQQLLEEARCRDSRQLLADSDSEIRRISEKLGYSNPANFTRAFKSWTGLAPRAWRQRYQQTHNEPVISRVDETDE